MSYYEQMKAKEARQLALLQASIEKQQASLKLYCFELKYGKIHLN
jgi:hypothetical protein